MKLSIGMPKRSSPSVLGMETWAKRILAKLESDPALDKPGLARACGIKPPSVFQWFSDTDSKPATKMIAGDNLVAAARYLGMTAEEIMTGAPSQPARLAADRLAADIETVESALMIANRNVSAKTKARLVVMLQDMAEPEKMTDDMLARVIMSMGELA